MFLFGLLWMPLLPGAILLMLAIFCFLTALGVPFYILYALSEYLHEVFFYKYRVCDMMVRSLQKIALHLLIVVMLTAFHFCLYSSILSTSVSLYAGREVVGCLEYEWDWAVHEWHWMN